MDTATTKPTSNPTGTKFWFDSQVMEVLISAQDTDGTLSIVRQTLGGGYAPPLHVHEREDQTLHVLDGSLTAWLDPMGESPAKAELATGDSIHLPRGIPHAFRAGNEGVTLLEINTPGGFEHFHLDAGDEPTHDGVPEQTPTDIERLARCAADHACTILGPPVD